MAQQTRTKVKIVSFAEIYSRALLQSLPSNYRGGTVMLQSQRESCSCRTCCSGFVTVSLLFVCGPILFNRNRRERRWWPSLLTELRSRFSVAALKMIRRQKLQIAKLFKIKLRTFEFTTAIEVVNDLSLLSFRHRLARCWRRWNGSQLT
ncbi:hypothetical protein DY000_02051770 [Brassica cretica]|uniref:Uncharacterized protein n=1 Tax=Brassica cretica TaxID=69181 RepID=A0ABQ7ACZ7_BRACR|nr:hypothetical protein DY000_02051770 [Brassica cretica]